MKKYERHYTWSHPLGESVIAHKDGAVSLLIEWDGLDMELCTEDERQQQWLSVYRWLSNLGPDLCAEFHWWREVDAGLARAYLDKGDQMVRGQAVAQTLRQAQAEHLACYAMSNRVGLVLTQLPQSSWFRGAKAALKQQARLAHRLLETAQRFKHWLPGGRIAPVADYLACIQQSYDREGWQRGARLMIDPHFQIAETVLREAPRMVDKAVQLGKTTTKVLYLYLYPDALPAWFTALAPLGVAMHVSHIIKPADTRAAMQRSERESDLLEGTVSKRGQDYTAKGMTDLAAFRALVADNNLAIFHNSYIIHLHGTTTEVSQAAEHIKDLIDKSGGQVRDADYIQLPYFRAGQPGQGYRAPMFRPDHTWQVADMLPLQVYRQGEANPESLRLGAASQLVGFSLSNQPVAHSFTVAMTGAGKGVDKVATIAETYPFGIDWYIVEIGSSYQWVVEAFGGTYTCIDPSETVVNPLPPFSVVNAKTELPLDPQLVGGTVQALAFLLSDGDLHLDVHAAAAAEMTLQMLYAVPDALKPAPTLEDYLGELETADYFDNEKQAIAARRMAENLHSFLSTAAGRIFTRPENLTLSTGITGVDLKAVSQASPHLLKFYLVFLSLRLSHMAFYSAQGSARVLLDEMHEFVRAFPGVVGNLISGIARMGRKENAAIDLVTQGISEIDILEKEVLNSMPLRSLLYRSDEWDSIATRINMPRGPLEAWKRFEYPMHQPYRPAMRSVGPEYYQLHLTFPDLIMDLASTTPEDLVLKKRIEATISDPLQRLQALQAARQTRSVA